MLAGQIASFVLENRYVRKEGQTIWARKSISLVRDPDGSPKWIISLIENVSERKQAEETQSALIEERAVLLESERLARTEAERANRMKDVFLANLSHELRTPLNSILGWTQVLRRKPVSDSSVRKGLEVIERNTRIQAQLISDLLDVSRITSGKMRLETRNCDPGEALEAAIDSLAPAAEAKRITLEKLIEPPPGPVLGDPSRLQQAFWNLLSNAVKQRAAQPVVLQQCRPARVLQLRGDAPGAPEPLARAPTPCLARDFPTSAGYFAVHNSAIQGPTGARFRVQTFTPS